MVESIMTVLERLKTDWATELQPAALQAACVDVGYTQWRDRVLNPVVTVQLFLLQILHRNTACRHLPHLSGLRFSASAYCQARAKLPIELFERLLERLGRIPDSPKEEEGRWHGHRTFFVDGSGCSMPDTPALQKEFGQPSQQRLGCGFPVAHLLALFQAQTGLLRQLVIAPLRTHDLARVQDVHPALAAGDLLVADRGLCSYAHLALLVQAGVHAVLRMGSRQIVDFTPQRPFVKPGTKRTPSTRGLPRSRWIRTHSKHDQCVEWQKGNRCPRWLDRAQFTTLPATLLVREVRYHLCTPGFRPQPITVVTTLVDAPRYPPAELADLYHTRWEAEVHLGQLKTTMNMDVLHCKTVAGVRKELLLFALVYNLVRLVMLQSARRQQVDVRRLSFLDALRWLRAPATPLALEDLLVNPPRPHRREPRVKKRRPKKFPWMTQPRRILKQQLGPRTVDA